MNENIKKLIRDVPNFPKQGIIFKDITPLLASPEGLKITIDAFKHELKNIKIDKVVAIESRGFILGAPLAYALNAGLVLARKPGKLPSATIKETFKLEYGEDSLEMHKDSIKPNEKIVIIDDVLATGGTMEAVIKLSSKLGGDIQKILFLIELSFLNGHTKLKFNNKQIAHSSLLTY